MRLSSRVLTILLLTAGAWGQEFEVVSIKPTPDSSGMGLHGCRGGPGSSDPGQIHCSHVTAGLLVFAMAYPLPANRFSGLDDRGRQPLFEIAAKVPRGATKEQVKLMWQRLLADRFKLAVHRETKEMPVYELVVAKGGLKAKKWVDHPANSAAEPWEPGVRAQRDKEGFPILPAGQTMGFVTDSKAWFVAPAGTTKDIAELMERHMSRPVIDATALTGKYDLKLSWTPQADNDNSAELLSAIESQLGLKLQPKKSAPVEILVVDRLEKTPTEN